MQPQTHPVQVELAEKQFVNLPQPEQLGYELNVSQLLTAQWGEGKEQKLLVQLQVQEQNVVLAGFSAWGVRLLSLDYSGEEIQTYVLEGLADSLPKPEQVLFNLMLAIWPIEAWQQPLNDIGWQLVETELKRELFDAQGLLKAEINYQSKPYIDGKIVFIDHKLDYKISIETKSSEK